MRSMLAIAFLLLVGTAVPQSVNPAQVDAIANRAIEQHRVPGMSIAVVRWGKVEYAKGYGYADVELKAPAKAETVYQIGSVTKAFTAALVLKLEEEGKLSITDPVSKHIDWLPTKWQAVTIEHLLNHTSGIPSYTGLPAMWTRMRQDVPLREIVELSKDLDMEFEPGKGWKYNNTGYVMLGIVLEQVSGKTYAQLLDERILAPLGMTSTRYTSWSEIVPHRASGYSLSPSGLTNAPYLSMTWPHAAGALSSSVLDLAKFDAALYRNELIGKESKAKMWTPSGAARPHDYGFGWMVSHRNGTRIIEHGGGIPGFTSHVVRVPEKGLAVVVLTNLDSPQAGIVAHEIVTLLNPELKAAEPSQIQEDPSPAVTRKHRMLLESALAGKIDRSDFSADLNQKLSDEAVKSLARDLASLGELRSFEFLDVQLGEVSRRRYRFTLGTTKLLFIVLRGGSGETVGVLIQPEV